MQAAGSDGTVSRAEMARLLKRIGYQHDEIEETIATMNPRQGVDELSFESWYRCHQAAVKQKFRMHLESMTLGQLVDWCRAAGSRMDIHRIETALDHRTPKTALISACLDVPDMRK